MTATAARCALGIATQGHGLLSRSITIYFRADCSKALRGRNLVVIYVHNPNVRGFRLEKTGLGGFLVVFTVGDINEPVARYVADTITTEGAVQLVRDAVGDDALEVNVEDGATWRAVAETADTFQAGPALVDTYDAERQPSGVLAMEQAYNRYVLRSDPDLGTEGRHQAVPDMHVEFNRYRSAAVIPDDSYTDDDVVDIDPRASRGLPGTRAPHVELLGNAGIASTLDLFGHAFVLLAGPDSDQWPRRLPRPPRPLASTSSPTASDGAAKSEFSSSPTVTVPSSRRATGSGRRTPHSCGPTATWPGAPQR